MMMVKPWLTLIPSRPARGAWIEIEDDRQLAQNQQSRPARGAWIELSLLHILQPLPPSRAPHGARGLKFVRHVRELGHQHVAPRMGRVD